MKYNTMKHKISVILTSALMATSITLNAGEVKHPDTSGWQPLFKEDLSNAIKPAGDVWTMKNGEITPSQDQCIWSENDYENFVLDLECRFGPGANSGIILYSVDTNNWVPGAIEIQVLDDAHERWKNEEPHLKFGSIFGHTAPKKAMGKPAGQWNRFTITCKGQNIKIVLNGEEIIDIDMKDYTSAETNPDGSKVPGWLPKPMSTLPTKGKIGFQGKHGGVPVWFRNIKIKELE